MVRPWAWPSHGSYLSQGSPRGGVGTSQVRLLLTGTGNMALKPPFSSLYYCSEVLKPLVVSPPPRSFLPVGIGGWHRRCLNLAMPHPGDALTWQCLNLATPTPGDASSWQHLKRLTCWLSSLGSLDGSHHTFDFGFDFDFDFGQRPGTGRYINLKHHTASGFKRIWHIKASHLQQFPPIWWRQIPGMLFRKVPCLESIESYYYWTNTE